MSRQWTVKREWKHKLQGQVWIVQDGRGRIGYFKYATPHQWYYSGPLIANEFISATLARRVGLPVARLESATVKGADGVYHKGLVSIPVKAKFILTWCDVREQVRCHPELHVQQLKQLRGLVAFDAWIGNVDRGTGKNLVLYRDRPSEKYKWYLIDHGNALWAPRRLKIGAYRSPIWDDVWRYSHVPKGLLRLQSSWRALEPMIRKIESLGERDIDLAIQSIPNGCLRDKESKLIKRMLLYRQKRLRMMMTRWLKYRGVKEHGYPK